MKKRIFSKNNLLFSLMILILYFVLQIFLNGIFESLSQNSNFIIKNCALIMPLFIISIIFIAIYYNDIKKDLKNFNGKMALIAIKNWLIGLGLMIISNMIITSFVGNIANNEISNREMILNYPLGSVIMIVLLAPIIEEIIFRLAPKKAFKNKTPYMIYSGLLFGLLHVLSSNTLIELLYIIPYGILGAMFAKSVYETDNILSSILTHSIHNFIAIALIFIRILGGL